MRAPGWLLRIRDRAYWSAVQRRALMNRVTHLEGVVGNARDARRIEKLECSKVLASDALQELARHVQIVVKRHGKLEARIDEVLERAQEARSHLLGCVEGLDRRCETIEAHDSATDLSVGALQQVQGSLMQRLGNLEDDVARYQDGC